MMTNEQQQTVALAATIQSLTLVNEVATKGSFDADNARPVLNSLVSYNPEDTLSAFGGNINNLRLGIGQAKKLLSDQLNRDIAQYLLAVFAIELKLVRNQTMRQRLNNEIHRIANHVPAPDGQLSEELTSDTIIAEFAELYKQTASKMEPRIMIKGNHDHLQNQTSANHIRGLLLAALRSAAFFRHLGGKRIDLMMKRSHYVELLNGL